MTEQPEPRPVVRRGPRDRLTVRIGDTDRELAVAALRTHYSAGRLDAAEFDDRVDAAYESRLAGDLAVLFSDLPDLSLDAVLAAQRTPRQPRKGLTPPRPAQPSLKRADIDDEVAGLLHLRTTPLAPGVAVAPFPSPYHGPVGIRVQHLPSREQVRRQQLVAVVVLLMLVLPMLLMVMLPPA